MTKKSLNVHALGDLFHTGYYELTALTQRHVVSVVMLMLCCINWSKPGSVMINDSFL